MRGTQFAELSAFVAVAEEASFTKAAKRLGLSTATLSQTVRSLEERLGVRLLNRTTRSVALTEAGERMLRQLRPLLDGFDAAIESVNAFRDRPAGHLRLTLPPPVAKFTLAPILARFRAKYPEITIEISVDVGLIDIVAGRFDAGFRRGNVIALDMIAVRDHRRHAPSRRGLPGLCRPARPPAGAGRSPRAQLYSIPLARERSHPVAVPGRRQARRVRGPRIRHRQRARPLDQGGDRGHRRRLHHRGICGAHDRRRASYFTARRFRTAAHAGILHVLPQPAAESGRLAGAHRVSTYESA